ncbi:MAG: DUF3843 family protein [Candidatus Cyclobacteriaceae bacterium M3_2C_046]
MAKKIIPSEKITQSWYLEKKPYQDFDNYDQYYLSLIQKILDILRNNPFPDPQVKLNQDQNKQLAYVLGGYFEDYMSEIGIWPALIHYHQKLYETPVPLMLEPEDEPDYDTNELNPADVQFIIWNFYSRIFENLIIPPQLEYFFTLSNRIFELLDKEVEKEIATDFYDEFLTISSEQDFYQVKPKLEWFARQSYLLGFEHDIALQKILKQESAKKSSREYIQMLFVFQHEDILFRNPTQWSAVPVLEWFTRIIQADQATKDQILNLRKRNKGSYQYVETDNDQLVFKHLYTNALYRVDQELVNDFQPDKNLVYLINFLEWQGKWHLSGPIIPIQKNLESKDVQDYQEKGEPDLFYFDPDYRKKTLDKVAATYASYQEVFGDDLVFFENGQALKEGVTKFISHHNQKYNTDESSLEHDLVNNIPEGFMEKKDLALFFNQGVGYEIISSLKHFLDLAQKETTNQEEEVEMINYVIFSNLSAQFILELNRRYNLHNLSQALRVNIDLKRELEYYLRFYKSGDFLVNRIYLETD